MARHCVNGKRALYDYCRDHGIPHRRCGKLIVATTADDSEKLASIRRGPRPTESTTSNCLMPLPPHALEPALNCTAAPAVPSTGIVDSHALMLALRGDAEDAGAAIAFNAPLLHAAAGGGEISVDVGGAAPMSLACRLLVNAAGLSAPAIARSIEGMPIEQILTALFRQGQLFQLRRPFPVHAPDLSGAGAGRPRCPPDAGPGRASEIRTRCRMGQHD